MKSDHFQDNDIRVNERLTKALLLFVPLILAAFLPVGRHIVSIPENELYSLVPVCFFFLSSPFILGLFKPASSFLKYYTIIDISVFVAFLNMIPFKGLYPACVLGVVISLLYFDPVLTAFSGIMNYLLLICVFGYDVFIKSKDHQVAFMASLPGIGIYSLEFLIVAPVAYIIALRVTRRIEEGNRLAMKLEGATKRYELALDSSRDVIYEYDIAEDRFKYYGVLLGSDMRDKEEAREAVVIDHMMVMLQQGHVLHPDDVGLIEDIIAGNDSDLVQVRMVNGDDFDWFEVESKVIYEDNYAVRIVGKIRNITGTKMEEQEFLHTSRKDSLTGFYDKIVGMRIIRRHMTQVGRMDTQQFLYIALKNAEDIGKSCGSVYLDALLLRLADILIEEVSDMDLPVRLSKTEFVLYLVNRNPAMTEQLMARVRSELSRVYVSDDIPEGMNLRMDVYDTLDDLEQGTGSSEDDPGYYDSMDDSYRNDMVSFAFNLLERSKDFENAINLLLDRIGNMYRLDSVRILRGTSIRNVYRCVYEWIAPEAENDTIGHILGMDTDVGGLRQKSDVFLCDSADISEDGGYFLFYGSVFKGAMRPVLEEKLKELTNIMATFIGKRFADSANRAKSDFLSSVSHEIRTPVNAIAGYADLILHESTSNVVENYAENIKTSSNNLLGIINDILDLSKMEAGKFQIVPERYFLHEIIQEVKNIMYIQIGDSPVSLVTNIDSSVGDGLIGDGMRIRQIFINLLSNAVKFTEEGQIGIDISWDTTAPEEGILTCCVWDTGIGIREDELHKIFSAYEQTDTRHKHRIKGTGLGLAITKQLVELMNGTIRVESEYGKGTRMVFTLPQEMFDAAPYDYNESSEAKASRKPVVPFTAPWGRVLLVDDNQVNLEVAKALLSHYKVMMETASSGREALKILEQDTFFDLIFMDHIMPEMDGLETATAIRKSGNPALDGIPIVALTANADVQDMEEQFILAGINGYLQKPIDLNELAKIMVRFIPDEKKEAS